MKSLGFITTLLVCGLFISKGAFAQIETNEQNFTESKVILKDIQKDNFFKKGAFDVRTGLLQVSANKAEDPLELNSRNEMPFVELAYEQQIYNRWGIALSLLHAQNALGKGATNESGEAINNTSVYQQVYQLGAQYKMILDETYIKNYVTFRVQYYGMTNNFELTHSQLLYIKSQSGLLFGIERSIPATEIFDIRGAFDFIYITDSKSDTILEYKESGNGLQLRADIFYNLSKISRLGVGYGISAFFNKYTDADFEARDRHTQVYKAFYLDYSYLF